MSKADAIIKGHSSGISKQIFRQVASVRQNSSKSDSNPDGLFGKNTISYEAGVNTLRRFDSGLEKWKNRQLRDNPLILVLDGVWLKGAIGTIAKRNKSVIASGQRERGNLFLRRQEKIALSPASSAGSSQRHTNGVLQQSPIRHLTNAKPVLFGYAVYSDGEEDVFDFEIEQGKSTNAWTKFCQRLYERGIKEAKLIVHDDCDAISNGIALCRPKALSSAMRLSHP